jgi:hypothetical protein
MPKNGEKVDKFYLVLTVILVLMSTLLIFSVRGVISMFLVSREIDSNSIGPDIRVEKEKLNEAYDFVFNRNIVKLSTP